MSYQYQRQQYSQSPRRGQRISRSNDNEVELFTTEVRVEKKRFFIDVKENDRGMFVKIVESTGRRPRIIMSLRTVVEVADVMALLKKDYDALGPYNSAGPFRQDAIKSYRAGKDSRRYYLDLRENHLGRFVKLAMLSPTTRSEIVLPAPEGLTKIGEVLTTITERFSSKLDEEEALPDSQLLRVDNKMFYFDVGRNRRGVFLRMSEVRQDYRMCITVPEKSWMQFRDILNEMAGQMQKLGGGKEETGGDGDTGAKVDAKSDSKQ